MEKRTLGNTGFNTTLFGFGALEIGRDWGIGERNRPDEQTANDVLQEVLNLGINLIDTASAYHRSEERIGQSIVHRRDEYFLASKCGEHNDEPNTYYDFSYAAIKASIDRSLTLLKTDHIDLMQIHFGPNAEKVLQEGETVRAMQNARQEGKIRFLGASPPTELVKACIQSQSFDVLQVDFSLLNRQSGPLIDEAKKKGIGILVRGALGYGKLTPRVLTNLEAYPEVKPYLEAVDGDAERLMQVALDFLRQTPSVSSILIGTKNKKHLQDLQTRFETPINQGDLQKVLHLT